jgi:hypothetical protein
MSSRDARKGAGQRGKASTLLLSRTGLRYNEKAISSARSIIGNKTRRQNLALG